jgi:hypothetical protein
VDFLTKQRPNMPDRIFVTFTPTTAPGSYHSAIHFERTDATGKVVQHWVIEAEPERHGQLSPLDNVFGVIEENLRQGDGASRFGKIQATVRKANQDDDTSAPYEIIAEGADLGPSFAKMQLFASGLQYGGFRLQRRPSEQQYFRKCGVESRRTSARNWRGSRSGWPHRRTARVLCPRLKRAFESTHWPEFKLCASRRHPAFFSAAPKWSREARPAVGR